MEPAGAEHDHAGHDHSGHDHAGHDHSGHDHAHSHAPAMNPECRREVEIEIPVADVDREMAQMLKRYRKEARIPGFRPGKVPEGVIRARFGESLRKDVLDALLPRYFRAAVEPQGLVPVSQPQVVDLKMHAGEPIRFKAEFEVLPPFEIAGWESVKIDRPDAALTEDDFNAEVAQLREQNAIMEPLADDHVLADGDYAQITFKGYFPNDAEPVAGEEQKHDLNGDNVLIEVAGKDTVQAFTDALRGSTVGQHMTLEVTYPDDFQERRLAGKSVRYEIEVTGAKKKILPELELENVKQYGEFESMDDFNTKMREDMARNKQARANNMSREKLSEALGQRFSFPVPEVILQQQIDTRLERGLRALAGQGMKTEDMRKLDFARLRDAQRDPATLEVRAAFVLDRIADEKQIQTTDEELERELTVASIQEREPLDTMRARLTEDGTLARIREQIRRDKTAQLVLDSM